MKVTRIVGRYPGKRVARELPSLIGRAYTEIVRRPTDLAALKSALTALLNFLASPSGRTDANCCATDLFCCLDEGWETDWEHLPDSYQDLLGDLGGAPHDTVQAPEVAHNFQSTPEQLIERLRKLPPPEGPVKRTQGPSRGSG